MRFSTMRAHWQWRAKEVAVGDSRQTAVKNDQMQASNAQPRERDVQGVIALYTAGQLAEAEKSALQLIEKFPGAFDVYNLLGTVRAGLGKTNEAVASYVQAITIKPDFAEAHNNLGAILKQLGLLDQAVESYRLALAAKPDFVQAHVNLGNVLRELGRLEEAAVS
jgi:tetratricopeptide (TPR) repeat protein